MRFVATLFLESGETVFHFIQKYGKKHFQYFAFCSKGFINTVRLISTIISVNMIYYQDFIGQNITNYS